MGGNCVNFIDLDLFLRFLKGWRQIWRSNLYSTRWRSEMDLINCNSHTKIFNGNVFSTYFANLIKIGPVTPEISRAKTTPFGQKWQKSAFCTKYLSKYGTDCHHNFNASRQMYVDYKSDISFVVAQRIGNQLILESFCSRRNWLRSLFALAFRKEMNIAL